MAAVKLERIIQEIETLFSQLISGILDPTIGLHEDSRAEIAVCIPPIGRTGGGATGA